MPVQVLTPPDSSNKLQIAAALGANRKRKPNIAIGGPGAVDIYNAWSNRDIAKKQLAQTKEENALNRTNNLEVQETANSGQMAVEKIRGKNSLATEGLRGENEVKRVIAEADALAAAQIKTADQMPRDALTRQTEMYLSQGERRLPLNEQVPLLISKKAQVEMEQRRTAALEQQKLQDQLNNVNPQTTRELARLAGKEHDLMLSPDEIHRQRLAGAKDYSTPSPDASKGSATGGPPPKPLERWAELTGADLLDPTKINGRASGTLLPYGSSHYDDGYDPTLGLKVNRTAAQSLIQEGLMEQAVKSHMLMPIQAGAAAIAEAAKGNSTLLLKSEQVMAGTHKAANDLIDNLLVTNDIGVHGVKAAGTFVNALSTYRGTLATKSPQEIRTMDPMTMLKQVAEDAGLADEFTGITTLSEMPSEPAARAAWEIEQAKLHTSATALQSVLNTAAAQANRGAGEKGEAQAELLRRASQYLTPYTSKLAARKALGFDATAATKAAQLKLMADSVDDNINQPPGPNDSPLSLRGVTGLTRASLVGLGAYAQDIPAGLAAEGRPVGSFFSTLDGYQPHEDPTLRDIANILSMDHPDFQLDPARYGRPGMKAADPGFVKWYRNNMTFPVDQKVFNEELMSLNAKNTEYRRAFKAAHNQQVAEQQAKMKISPPQNPPQGGSQSQSQSKPQPKKPSSGGGEKK